MISGRFERYEKGKTKGMPALEASKRIRAKILKNYLLIYKVHEDVIAIHRMIHVKRSLRKRYGT